MSTTSIWRINGHGYVIADTAAEAHSAWREVVIGGLIVSVEQLSPTAAVAMPHTGGPIEHTCDEWLWYRGNNAGYMFAVGYA